MKINHKYLVAAMAGLLLALVAAFLWRRRRRTQPNQQPPIDV